MWSAMKRAWGRIQPKKKDENDGDILVIPFGAGKLAVGSTMIKGDDDKYIRAVAIMPRQNVLVGDDEQPLEDQGLPDGTVLLAFQSVFDAHELIKAILHATELKAVPEPEPAAND